MDHLGTALLVAISPDPLPCRNGSFPWIGRVKYPILSCPLPSRRNLPHYSKPLGGSLGRKLATGIQLRGEPAARHRSEAAAGVTRRSARWPLLHRRRGLRLV